MAASDFHRPVKASDLRKALNIVGGVFEGQIAPIRKPSQTTFQIIDEEKGTSEKFRFADNLFTMTNAVLSNTFKRKKDDWRYFSVSMRMVLLFRLAREREAEFSAFIKQDKESTYIHDTLIKAAAKCPIGRHGKFLINDFRSLVREFASTK